VHFVDLFFSSIMKMHGPKNKILQHVSNYIESIISSSLPDDRFYVIRSTLEYFNVCLLDFCIIKLITSTIVII